MVKLRLRRQGTKHKPIYRIVAVDNRKKRDGSYIEQIGFFDPIKKITSIKKDLALKWLNYGAKPTETVKNILSKEGIIKDFVDNKKTKVSSSKKQKKRVKKSSKEVKIQKKKKTELRKKAKLFLKTKTSKSQTDLKTKKDN